MGAHNDTANDYSLFSDGTQSPVPPASGGTFNLGGKDRCIFTVPAGTYKLPNGTPLGVSCSVYATEAATITNAAGTTVLSLSAEQLGEFTAKTATTWVAATSAVGGTPASRIALGDAGGHTDATNVEDALQLTLRSTQVIDVPLSAFYDADGDPLAKFADNASPNPGINLANSEALGLRWNNNATQNQPVIASILLPRSAAGQALTLHVLASKTGATSGDATTFTVTAFENATGSLHDASSDIGGVTSAMTGAATAKTVQHVTLALDNLEGNPPSALTFTITPTSGTLGVDDVIVQRVWFTYMSGVSSL